MVLLGFIVMIICIVGMIISVCGIIEYYEYQREIGNELYDLMEKREQVRKLYDETLIKSFQDKESE